MAAICMHLKLLFYAFCSTNLQWLFMTVDVAFFFFVSNVLYLGNFPIIRINSKYILLAKSALIMAKDRLNQLEKPIYGKKIVEFVNFF